MRFRLSWWPRYGSMGVPLWLVVVFCSVVWLRGAGTNVVTAASTNSPPDAAFPLGKVEFPQATFVDEYHKGVDPFFPNSNRRRPKAETVSRPTLPTSPADVLQLKGVIVSNDHPLALINNQVLAVGDEADIDIRGGRIRIKCLAIDRSSVTVSIVGKTKPIKLRVLE